ncbi:hypothetical protein [Methylobacterium sp. CM6257]
MIVVRVLGLCLLACGSAAAQDGAPIPFRLTAKQIDAVKNGVRSQLKDPDSARFSRPFVATKNSRGLVNVCGYVNSKNGYGGFSGDIIFGGMMMKNNTVFMPLSIDISRSAQATQRELCLADGIDLN